MLVMEGTIVLISLAGWLTTRNLMQKARPLLILANKLTPEQIQRGADKLAAWLSKGETEKRIEEEGL